MGRGVMVEDYVRAWKVGSAIIQKSAGSYGIKLYQKVGQQNKLLNVATWESKTAREIAMESLKRADHATRVLLHRHEDFGKVNVIGEFEDTGWTVNPPEEKAQKKSPKA